MENKNNSSFCGLEYYQSKYIFVIYFEIYVTSTEPFEGKTVANNIQRTLTNIFESCLAKLHKYTHSFGFTKRYSVSSISTNQMAKKVLKNQKSFIMQFYYSYSELM